jgi:hypothetical protein
MILKIFCVKQLILKNIYLSIKYFFKYLKLHSVLKNVSIMDQSCPVVHKSRRPQARLQTAKLFCNNCGDGGMGLELLMAFLSKFQFGLPGLPLNMHCLENP